MINPIAMADAWLNDIQDEYQSQTSNGNHPSGLNITDYQRQRILTGRITNFGVPMDHLGETIKSEIRSAAKMIINKRANGYEIRY